MCMLCISRPTVFVVLIMFYQNFGDDDDRLKYFDPAEGLGMEKRLPYNFGVGKR